MKNKFEELIELFIAEDEAKAKDLFHEIVVEKSREIYEGLVDEDQVDEKAESTEEVEEAKDEDVDEDMHNKKKMKKKMEGEESDIEESEEEVDESDVDEELGGDSADDMIDDIEADEEGLNVDEASAEENEEEIDELKDAIAELEQKFEDIVNANDLEMGDEEAPADEMDMDDMEMDKDEMESVEETSDEATDQVEETLEEGHTMEKAPAPVTSEESGVNTASIKEPKKMATPANAKSIAQGGEETGGATPKSQDMGMTTKPDMKKV